MEVISRTEAIAQGLKRYFTGIPCIHGHVSERYICRVCCWCGEIKAAINRQKASRKKYMTQWRAENRDKCRNYSSAWDSRHSVKKLAATKAYKNRKLNRTPPWANLKKIECIYQLAAWASKFTDEPLDVDHIMPMHGKNISGLHTHNNLQILKRSENRSKGNQWN